MYNNIKTFLKNEWKYILFLILLFVGLTWEFPYIIYTPGGSINMSERIEGNNIYDMDGTLSMTYVKVTKGTLPFIMMSKIIPNWDMVDYNEVIYDNTDLETTTAIDKIYMREAISNAEYVAYTAANIDFQETGVHNLITFVDEEAKTNLMHDDELVSIDGTPYTSLKDFQEYINSKKPGDKIEIEYIRNGKTFKDKTELIEIENKTKVGVGITSISDYKTDFNIDVKTKTSESGPSGGLITALAIYNAITEKDITNGKKIMGTGTISKDGTVGEIGGVKYKLLGAYKNNADIFICPEENYKEALQVKNDNNMDITLISAHSFIEALEKLRKI